MVEGNGSVYILKAKILTKLYYHIFLYIIKCNRRRYKLEQKCEINSKQYSIRSIFRWDYKYFYVKQTFLNYYWSLKLFKKKNYLYPGGGKSS